MNSFMSVFFDIVILGALGVTVFYCLRLSKQFNQMRADRKAFEALIQSLNGASARAEASIHAFRETAVGSGDILQDKINRAKAISEELEIMIQAGDSLANRLQEQAEKSRRAAGGNTEPAGSDDASASRSGSQPRTRAEKELVEALKKQNL